VAEQETETGLTLVQLILYCTGPSSCNASRWYHVLRFFHTGSGTFGTVPYGARSGVKELLVNFI